MFVSCVKQQSMQPVPAVLHGGKIRDRFETQCSEVNPVFVLTHTRWPYEFPPFKRKCKNSSNDLTPKGFLSYSFSWITQLGLFL